MPLPRISNALRLRGATLGSPIVYRSGRYLSTTLTRRIAMADGGKAVDDIDLAFDYPSEMQATYTMPSGVHQTRLDKEMGYPDQRVLYAIVGILGCAGLYSAVTSTINGPMDHIERDMTPALKSDSYSPSSSSSSSSSSEEGHESGAHMHGSGNVHFLPNRKPTDSKMERFLGRGG